MKEFGWVVIAGVLIFIIGGLLAGYFPKGEKLTEKDILFKEDFGVLGSAENTYTDMVLGDISVGTTRANRTIKEVDQYKIKNGLFSKKIFEYEFQANNPKEAYLSFEVLETNLYGNLIVELNGKKELNIKIMESATPKLVLTNVKKGINKLVIKGESSGLKFWAPTVYRLGNIKVILNDYGIHKFSKTFKLHPYELHGFDRAELSFFITKAEREEPLEIKVNGNPIYDQRPIIRALPYTVIFHANNTGLHLGENILEISTGQDSTYELDNSLLKVFYFGTPNQTVVKRIFNILPSQYRKISKDKYQGLIEFDNKIYLRGNLEITLQNETHNSTFEIFPTAGINRIFFDKEHISVGKNEVIIKTDGSFEINNFEIKIVERRKD